MKFLLLSLFLVGSAAAAVVSDRKSAEFEVKDECPDCVDRGVLCLACLNVVDEAEHSANQITIDDLNAKISRECSFLGMYSAQCNADLPKVAGQLLVSINAKEDMYVACQKVDFCTAKTESTTTAANI